MTITVYTTPSCQQCNMTKRWLTKNDITFNTVDLTTSPEAAAMVKALGYRAAPVVMAGTEHWTGFRPDLLAPLAAA